MPMSITHPRKEFIMIRQDTAPYAALVLRLALRVTVIAGAP